MLRKYLGYKMLQEIKPHVYNNQFKNYQPNQNDELIIIRNKTCLVKENSEEIVFPKVKEYTSNQYYYLFSIDDMKYFTVLEEVDIEGYHYISVDDFRYMTPQHIAFALITGYQLVNWYKNHVYCPKCGHKMHIDDIERKVVCEDCGHFLYPQICPAVIVGIIHEEEIVLTQYINGKNKALVAGFNEIGETIEETVIREVKEETGLDVENLHYYKSQPWSYTSTLLFGFYCEVKGDPTIIVDHSELKEATWYKREDIPDGYLSSLTSEMMHTFKIKGREVLK